MVDLIVPGNKPERGLVGKGENGFTCRGCGGSFAYTVQLNGYRECPDCGGFLREREPD